MLYGFQDMANTKEYARRNEEDLVDQEAPPQAPPQAPINPREENDTNV